MSGITYQHEGTVHHIRRYAMVAVCLLVAGLTIVTACNIRTFIQHANAPNPLASPPRTDKLGVIAGLLSATSVVWLIALYKTQRRSSFHQDVVNTWSIPFLIVVTLAHTYFWLVYYPLPRHGHHIDKFLLLTVLSLIWGAWYAWSPRSLHRFLSGRFYSALKVAFLNFIIFVVMTEIVLHLADPLLGRSGLFAGKHTPADLKPHVKVSGSIGTSNSQGFRDIDRPIEKPPHQKRVLAIGDSFTWGAGVSYDETFVTLLEHRLQSEFASAEIVNEGVPGWEPPQELHLLKNYGIRWEPDIVLLNFFVGNDIMRRRGAETERALIVAGQSYYVHDNGNWVHDNIGPDRWYLYHNVNYLLRVGMLTIRQGKHDADASGSGFSPLGRSRKEYLQESEERTDVYLREYPPSVQSSWLKTQSTLREFKEFLSARNVRLMVVLIPDQIQLDWHMRRELFQEIGTSPSAYDFEKPQKLLMEWCQQNDMPCLDLLPEFKNHPEPTALYLRNDLHWSASGHALAAKCIFPVLKAIVLKHIKSDLTAISDSH